MCPFVDVAAVVSVMFTGPMCFRDWKAPEMTVVILDILARSVQVNMSITARVIDILDKFPHEVDWRKPCHVASQKCDHILTATVVISKDWWVIVSSSGGSVDPASRSVNCMR